MQPGQRLAGKVAIVTGGGTGVGRAIATALLADEPTSSLDKENSYRLFEILNHFNHKKGLTLVWATHNKELIKQFPGKIAHLDSGRLVYSGHACFI